MRLSVDDGSASDIRIFGLAKKYNIPITFYWPVDWHSLAYSKGYVPLSYSDAWLISRTAEIGGHTITHPLLTQISQNAAFYEIANCKPMLEKMFKTQITKFAPPRGYTNERLTDYTLNIYESQRLTKGEDLVHIHPNSGANDNKPWREAITKKTKELWCHGWEISKYGLWGELEECLKSI